MGLRFVGARPEDCRMEQVLVLWLLLHLFSGIYSARGARRASTLRQPQSFLSMETCLALYLLCDVSEIKRMKTFLLIK